MSTAYAQSIARNLREASTIEMRLFRDPFSSGAFLAACRRLETALGRGGGTIYGPAYCPESQWKATVFALAKAGEDMLISHGYKLQHRGMTRDELTLAPPMELS